MRDFSRIHEKHKIGQMGQFRESPSSRSYLEELGTKLCAWQQTLNSNQRLWGLIEF